MPLVTTIAIPHQKITSLNNSFLTIPKARTT